VNEFTVYVCVCCVEGMDARQYRRFIEEHKRLQKPADCPVVIYGTMLHCWAHECVSLPPGGVDPRRGVWKVCSRGQTAFWPTPWNVLKTVVG